MGHRHPWRPALVGLAAAAMLAGCGSAPPPLSAPQFPPRPASLRVDHVAPCALLRPSQLKGLGLSTGQSFQSGPAPGDQACSFDTTSGDHNDPTMIIGVRPDQPATDELANPYAVPVTIARYGAAQVSSSATSDGSTDCVVVVDVADGQSLAVEDQAPTGDEATACHQVREAAAAALSNLADRGQ